MAIRSFAALKKSSEAFARQKVWKVFNKNVEKFVEKASPGNANRTYSKSLMLLALHWGINLTRAVLAWYENCPRGNRGKKIPSSRRTLPSGAELWKTFGAELLAA